MVRVLVGSAVIVHVEQPVIAVLAIVATAVDTRVGRVEVPVIARTGTAQTVPLVFLLKG